ncbi:MAG: RHS repeat-associated core domain-containing protein, partial [Candidatus Sulfotelmatobacter sp.]
EPGPLTNHGPEVNPRWVGTGWTIFNNKGKPVRQYEPFFSVSHTFQFASIVGVSPILFYDPTERVVATLHPNRTYEKVIFDPWRQENWDVNDTVLESHPARDPDVGDFFSKLPHADYLPTWYDQRIEGQLGSDEQQAAIKTSVHANTPTILYLDSLGRTFLTLAHNRFERKGIPVDQHFATRSELDIENNQRAVIDALDRVAMRYDYDMLSTRLRQISIDAGTRWTLHDILGKLLLSWDSRSHRFRHEYDALHRPTNFYVRTAHQDEILAERVVYGEGQPHDFLLNLRNKPFRQFDAAGIITNEHYDFKGNLLRSKHQLLEDYRNEVDWSQSPELEPHVFTTTTTYDALNRAITLTTPDSSVARPKYNEANLLESLAVNLRGAKESTSFVTFINYNAKGQREIIDYGNGSHTRCTYDPLTFRLIHLHTQRKHDHERLQDLHYTFDPIGNITSIRDDAHETVYFRNQVVSPRNDYVYDAIYRMISAEGREHAGNPGEPQLTHGDVARMNYPLPSDSHALHRYREQYEYNGVGNILQLLHSAPHGNWARKYRYGDSDRPHSNRLSSTEVGQWKELYSYDHDGNMTRMPHLPKMEWDGKDQLHATRTQVTNTQRGETTYYVYNSTGRRMRKVTERGSGSRKHERIYLGSLEIYRRYDSVGASTLERETLHLMDDKRRIALIETKTLDDSRTLDETRPRIRFQFDNHLNSAVLELDERASVISYEEYYPYGSTSFESADTASEVSKKRYRYTGKERDEETGLYYYGARYYAPWISVWTSCDPKELLDISANQSSTLQDTSAKTGLHAAGRPLRRSQARVTDHDDDSRLKLTNPSPKAKEDGALTGDDTIQLYGFVGQNPVCRLDPDGRDAIDATKKFFKEAAATVRHPVAAHDTKSIFDDSVETEKPSISTLAVRFSTKIGLQENEEREGSQVNAVRHTIWQAILTHRYGAVTAKTIADSHEANADAIENEDAATKTFKTLDEADQSIDLRNNIIGRDIGSRNDYVWDRAYAEKVLEVFHEQGLWTAEKQADGTFKISRQKLSDKEYESALHKLYGLDELGLRPEQAQQRQRALDNTWSAGAQRAFGSLEWNIKRLYNVP